MPVAAAGLFTFHLDPLNLVRISPPVPPIRLVEPRSPASVGDDQQIRLGIGPLSIGWTARIVAIVAPEGDRPGYLEDRMIAGPFRLWRHQHQVHPADGHADLCDVVEFRLLPTAVGALLERVVMSPGLRLMFAWRHRRTRSLLSSTAESGDS